MAPSYTPEIRQDLITKQWVACAPTRTVRPHQTGRKNTDRPPPEDPPVENCPFCPGHEEMLPSVRWQLDDPEEMPWRTRVVPNKYPAFTPDRPSRSETCGLYRARASRGRQEVVVDTPYHHQRLVEMPVSQVDAILQTYLARYRKIRTGDHDLIPFVFRNHGPTAGASIAHPHSQIISTEVVPPQVAQEESAARSRWEDIGRCPYCEMIETELDAEERLVWASDTFVAFVPFAARVPYEMWILPRDHEPEFGRLGKGPRRDLAKGLQIVLQRLHDCLDDPDYNFFVRSALDFESGAPHLHWSLRIHPRMTVEAGFELNTGVRINPSIPERDAAVLRGEDFLDED